MTCYGYSTTSVCGGFCRLAHTRVTRTADGKIHIQDLPRAEWFALVKDAHVGYKTLGGV